MNILFVVPYPVGEAPSQRFRFEQYFQFLSDNNWTYSISSFLDLKTWSVLYKPGFFYFKVFGIIIGFIKRIFLLFRLPFYDFVFIHREATPLGPPWFEWIASKVFFKRIIYDFDDAIWIPNTSVNNKIVRKFKWHHKVPSICKWSYKISCGNSFLQAYASQFNGNSFVIPTTIDTIGLHKFVKQHDEGTIVIGWTGTHSTLKYLDPIIPVLKELEKHYIFKFELISNREPSFYLESLVFKPWNKETEIDDLLRFNIGVMPLVDDPWSNGKCAFKALQYMALGIPAVVSPVGMNTQVVDHGINGFLCDSFSDWYFALEQLIIDVDTRKNLGKAARQKIEDNYSVISVRDNFLRLFT